MKPKFKHDCERCVPIGHFFGHDVYFCNAPADGLQTVLARYGDGAGEYTSCPITVLKDQMKPDHRIAGDDPFSGPWSMPYVEYVFSDRGLHGSKAVFAAAAAMGVSYMSTVPPAAVRPNPQVVKQIREFSSLPLSECMALALEANNDPEKAKQLAREKHLRTRPQWAGLDLPPPEPR